MAQNDTTHSRGLPQNLQETPPQATGQLDRETLRVRGARVHNLKNVTVEIPHNAITVVSGVSGSGKSSLAFDTMYAEGQRRYVESLSAYARQFLERMEKPEVDEISGIAPAVAIRQKNTTRNPRSTVALLRRFTTTCGCFLRDAGRRFASSAARKCSRILRTKSRSGCLVLERGRRFYVLYQLAGRSGACCAAATSRWKSAAGKRKSEIAAPRQNCYGCR